MNGVALVTGAASGIGAATVRAFVARGVTKIALADLQKDKLEDMAAELVKGNPQIEVATFVCDVSKEEDVASMVEGAAKKFSRVDYAVNCAGITNAPTATAQLSTEVYDRVVNINQRGIFFCVREQLKVMEKQDVLESETDTARNQRGSIVNIASIAGLVGTSRMAAYTASKHAVVGLVKTCAIEYAANKIRINGVAPGYVDTPMTQGTDVATALKYMPPIPAQRPAAASEVADVVVFLSSTGASYVNGATWAVDGGYSIV